MADTIVIVIFVSLTLIQAGRIPKREESYLGLIERFLSKF